VQHVWLLKARTDNIQRPMTSELDKVQVLLRPTLGTAKCYAKKGTTQLNTKKATTTREIRKTKQPQKEQQRGSNIGCVLMELLSGRTEGVAFINR
jgi:hypothetical protein